MSMLASFRPVAPRLLMRLRARPALVDEVIRYRAASGDRPATDADAFPLLLPVHMRKAIEKMPEATRADFLAHSNKSIASPETPEIVKEQIAAIRQPKASDPGANLDPADVGEELDIEKAWHGVHFLLCGVPDSAPPPLGDAILGGTEIGPDRGYGAARYLEAAQVTAVSVALTAIDSEEFESRYDPLQLERHHVYPGGWSKDAERQVWLRDAYAELRAFYANTAQSGFGVLMHLS